MIASAHPSALRDALASARRVRATAHLGPRAREGLEAETVASSDPPALEALRSALAVKRVTRAICGCWGGVTFEFFGPRGGRLASVRWHHGNARWARWPGEAVLVDASAPLQWMAAQGLPGPLRRFEEEQARRRVVQEASVRDEQDWRAGVPACLRDLTDAMLATSRSGQVPPRLLGQVRKRFAAGVPDAVERARQLLEWYGSGSGRYSGFPVHEGIPEELLRDVPIETIVSVLEAPGVAPRHDAGAVRHLVGWKSREHQAEDLARLPPAVRMRLLAGVRAAGDADKRARAESWLGPHRDAGG